MLQSKRREQAQPGAGFSVVADEIKKLSEDSADAAKEIFDVCGSMKRHHRRHRALFQGHHRLYQDGHCRQLRRHETSLLAASRILWTPPTARWKTSSVCLKTSVPKQCTLTALFSITRNNIRSIDEKASVTNSIAQKLNTLTRSNAQTAAQINDVVEKFN